VVVDLNGTTSTHIWRITTILTVPAIKPVNA
jgi:hypothetical protein